MPHSFGYRARTRDMFARSFRNHGRMPNSKILQTYKIGQIVDIKGDGAVQKGMPHKFYHGKTGVIWNVTKRAIGVEVKKVVGIRQLRKRIHVRVEHVKPSTSRQGFLDRVQANDAAARAHKAGGAFVPTRRVPAQPRTGGFIKNPEIETLFPQVYTGIVE
mmetsp:Transcript_5278/g.8285  ORF Transcript_5278/g.8285 Transcript_5278/m.8285 type:complete len:160 (-) Transcript_5278:70-549(-)|eukprot:CAMPEP_0175104642 /NCGR_PEP_ID=MMETSP0086_2-20121207/9877_1 /TAXON_ID=136419 /ORGANISM="Unknown Unknown, Strain D1" /LENGTH=159 /DNA_ID=CAMNT_0016380129 /DNA_START=35 /DNA_END=514 /DNA_ORIENTATION=+